MPRCTLYQLYSFVCSSECLEVTMMFTEQIVCWDGSFSLLMSVSTCKILCPVCVSVLTVACWQIGVKITLSSNSLTKIVTFTPFFVLINDANVRQHSAFLKVFFKFIYSKLIPLQNYRNLSVFHCLATAYMEGGRGRCLKEMRNSTRLS